jgi:nicotianamine synthase
MSPNTNMSSEAVRIIDEVVSLVDALASLQSLKPCPEVNQLFGRLVSLCIKPYTSSLALQVLQNKQIQLLIPRLRQFCSEGEGELERYWANAILEQCHGLAEFPYYSNYEDLCCLELSNILAVLPCRSPIKAAPAAIAFIGSGPLPLTSFIIADYLPGAIIHNIDIDPSAIELSSALAGLLRYDDRLTFQLECATASSSSLADFDIVYLAALVGTSMTEKMSVIKSVTLRMRKDALLCVRSAAGLRGLLYPVEFKLYCEMGATR